MESASFVNISMRSSDLVFSILLHLIHQIKYDHARLCDLF